MNHSELLLEHQDVINEEKQLFNIMSNIYKIFNSFVHDDTQSSFICFLTFNIRNKKKLFELMKSVFNKLLHERTDIEYVIIDSVNFEYNYKKIKEEKLEKGKKIFLITTYQTVGAGINLQYRVTEDNKKYCPHLKVGVERDYDGIYLSKPINIIPSVNSSYFDHHTLAHGLYALEYLKESKELSLKKFKANIGNLFRKALLNYNKGYDLQSYYYFESVCIAAAKILAQAIGRLCRTEYKNSVINIYIAKENYNYLYPIIDVLKKNINNYEFNIIIKSISKDSIEVDTLQFFEFKEKNRMSNEYIWNILKNYSHWSKEEIEKWRKLRENVLKFPTCDNLLQHDFVNCYFEFEELVNSYSYDKSWKYLKGVSTNMEKYPYKMSIASCGLESAIDNIPGLKEYFMDLGYAVDFKKNRYIL